MRSERKGAAHHHEIASTKPRSERIPAGAFVVWQDERMTPRSRRSRSLSGFAVAAVLALALGFAGAAPSPALAAPAEEPISPAIARIVTVDTTVRAEPSHDAAAVTSLTAGAQVSISAQVPAWRKVTVDGAEGWVPYSVTAEVPRRLDVPKGRELTVDTTLRAQPSEKAGAVLTAFAHTYVSVAAVSGAWRKVSTANGAGWVPASAIDAATFETPASSATKVLNVRETASGGAPVALVLRKGQTVKVLGTRGAWSSVMTGSHNARAAVSSGWTATKYLIPYNIRVTETALNLRARPFNGKVLAVIPKGAQVVLTGSRSVDTSRTPSAWHYVEYGSLKGWVASAYLERPY